MTGESCDRVGELLVDYADADLASADAGRVSDHLGGCPDCREKLRLLRHSLDLAREVWQESAAAALPSGRRPSRLPRRRLRLAACAAGSVIVLGVIVGTWFLSGGSPRRAADPADETQQPDPGKPADEVDIETLIAREAQAARLAAAVRLLATEPGLEHYRKQAERYLAEAYGGTAAAQQLSIVPYQSKEPES